MLQKIKTLKEIIEPKANKLGISFEEMLECISDDKKFEYAMLHFNKIKNNGNKGFYRKILNSFMPFDKFTEFCQNNFYVTPTNKMYNEYNSAICFGIIECQFNELKESWKNPERTPSFPKRWGEESTDDEKFGANKWTDTIKSFNNIEEIKEHTKTRIAEAKSVREAAIAGLWEQGCISMFTQFHAKNTLWDKIDELGIENKIPTRPANKPGVLAEWKNKRGLIDATWIKARDYSKSKGGYNHDWGNSGYNENMCKFEYKYHGLISLSYMLDYFIDEKPDILKLKVETQNSIFRFNGLEKVMDNKWYHSKGIRKHYSEEKFNTLQNKVKKQLKKVDKIIA